MIGNFVLIGIIAIAVTIIAVASLYLLKRKSRKVPAKEIHAIHSISVSEALMLQENDCKEIPIKEIYAATNNLHIHNFIGQGVAGKVYKGVLSNGWHVAIKHIVKDGQAETFLREVTSLSHVRHPNLVILRGYCEKEFECFLVYELCGNGSLSEWLFGREKVLSWHQRLKIAIGSARGLHFLHTFEGGCIVHRDIKPTNILLDDNFEAKLSDFGLSKFIDVGVSHVSSEVRGTFGYVDPEYRQNHHVNAAGDVYSFGMVLLQIISGKRVIGLDITMPASLHQMAKTVMNGGNTAEFVDLRMNGEFSMEAFNLVLKVAISCTAHRLQRPSMGEVIKKLEKALEISARNNEAFSVSFA
ncbi:putative serine/threonine-protein kinase isoform X1 [Dendrobium catenatum]|uniref:Receptor-like protein kinase HERK 1 n=1 Tax=Dendrobium catenatum TaxID=906689 RepID=A0A2I0VLC5_9ASPA|nr:putative serine/threonine-protein kinase isoform X1 [Dendrobium catenatum]PKU64219.1 Receptor-like protein kinase HERK 1 [Dendrobium catenatum]